MFLIPLDFVNLYLDERKKSSDDILHLKTSHYFTKRQKIIKTPVNFATYIRTTYYKNENIPIVYYVALMLCFRNDSCFYEAVTFCKIMWSSQVQHAFHLLFSVFLFMSSVPLPPQKKKANGSYQVFFLKMQCIKKS